MQPLDQEYTVPDQIAYIARLMFERELTDLAGGNISARDEDTLYITPTLAGNKHHWRLDGADMVSGSIKDMESIKAHPKFSRQGLSHLAIYTAFPFVGAVIHAHPKYIRPFVAAERPIPPVTNASDYFGTLTYHEPADLYSQDEADKIVKILKGQDERMRNKAGAVLMPRHGIILASGDLLTAVDCLERINNNAFAVMAQAWLD